MEKKNIIFIIEKTKLIEDKINDTKKIFFRVKQLIFFFQYIL